MDVDVKIRDTRRSHRAYPYGNLKNQRNSSSHNLFIQTRKKLVWVLSMGLIPMKPRFDRFHWYEKLGFDPDPVFFGCECMVYYPKNFAVKIFKVSFRSRVWNRVQNQKFFKNNPNHRRGLTTRLTSQSTIKKSIKKFLRLILIVFLKDILIGTYKFL